MRSLSYGQPSRPSLLSFFFLFFCCSYFTLNVSHWRLQFHACAGFRALQGLDGALLAAGTPHHLDIHVVGADQGLRGREGVLKMAGKIIIKPSPPEQP